MATIVGFIDQVLMNADNEAIIANVRKEVNAMMQSFPLYK
jgi:glycine hydroxymethyltransferase